MINDDRFDHPAVDDPEALARELRDGLAGLIDDDGDRVFREVLLAEEAYADAGSNAPDVIARPASGNFPTTLWSPMGTVTSPTENFEHRYRGIVAADGPLFTDGTVEGMSIVEGLPTILAALGELLSPNFDGEPRLDLLRDPSEPTDLSEEDVPEARTKQDDISATARDDATEQRLADLGYIE